MSMYHIAKNGQPALCRANTRSCPLGNGEHFESSEKAYEALLNGTAKLPKHPAAEAKGHTFNSLMYHADNNVFRLLSPAETKLPSGFYGVEAKIDGVRYHFALKGETGSPKAKVVGYTKRTRLGEEAWVSTSLTGGTRSQYGSDTLKDICEEVQRPKVKAA